MAPSRQWFGAADRPYFPPKGQSSVVDFKEWWHFNVIDDDSGLDIIINLNVEGDIYRPGGGQASLILLIDHPATGWHGGIDLFDGIAAGLGMDGVNITLGASRIAFADDHYVATLVSADASVVAELIFHPTIDPLVVIKDTPLGGGHINWVLMPNMMVSGHVRIGEVTTAIKAARGYHDHNWGRWQWGADFGWEWGFCAAGAEPDGVSFVYDRTTDRGVTTILEHSLMLWRGERLLRLFTRHRISARRNGIFTGKVRRKPGPMALLNPSRVNSIPQSVDIAATDGADWIKARYVTGSALQIAIPNETGPGLVEVNETMGMLTVEGVVDGHRIDFHRRACFEFVA